ncbi:MAG TPA: thiamine pyrophosphate-requiring protein [Solirubrobacteraceae bacterium]|nr:thiamine pyrophosphate-requiring protein [Solirubrobacteraceae bacterium]
MSTPNVSVFMLRRLREWGVTRVYGYPGDGSNGLNLAFHDVGDEIEFVQTRHEELAAFAACAHAKLTGELGVCMATSGPGAIHLLNGLYDARLDHAPVLAIVGQQKRMSLGGDYQQEVDLRSLYKDVANEFVGECNDPRQAGHLVDRAVRTALAERTVTAVIVPSDVQEQPYEEPPREHGAINSAIGYQPPVVVPYERDVARAADVLNAGAKVALLVGAGAKHATDEVIEVAELLGAGVAKALNGRAAVPDDLPFVTGAIGLLGTAPSDDMMQGCDTLLMVGTGFPYAEWLPEPGQARGVQIDVDGKRLGIRYPTEVNLVGDAQATLRALIPRLRRKEDRSWREEIERGVERWWRLLAERARAAAEPVNPQLVFHELDGRLPDRAIVLADSGSATNWWARHLRLRRGMDAALSGTLATMCPAVPYALAAKLAYPDRPVIACLGDGAMQMLGINGLIDLATYADRWAPPLVVLVLNNGDLNQVTWEQRVLAGEAKLESSQSLPPFDFAAYARQLGLEGIRVERPGDVGPAWDRALAAGGPAVLDVVTDPEVPPLPPHIRMEHAKGMASALLHGDPESGRIVRQSLREKLRDLVGG